MSERLKFLGVDVVIDSGLAPDGVVYFIRDEFGIIGVKLSSVTAKFDPTDRIKDGKPMHVTFSSGDWAKMERTYGHRLAPADVYEIIMGIFDGRYKVIKTER